MERKHQVFVSSTYRDLMDERKEVIHALLELDCIPAGMELFPATDEDAWSLIKEVIDGCDYYVLILAGKYGSTNNDGIGYTEMEFDYAVSKNMPIICFLHEDITQLSVSKVENTEMGKEKLDTFRKKTQEKHCKFWSSAHDLGGKVSRSLIQLKKKHPSDGWVPGKYAVDQTLLADMETMRARIAELEYEALLKKDVPPPNYEELSGGEDELDFAIDLKINKNGDRKACVLPITWDKLFSYCGTALTGECTSESLSEKIQLCLFHHIPKEYENHNKYEDITVYYVLEDQVQVQFQALGLMTSGTKKRAVSDHHTYWKLTPFGESHLIQVRALRKTVK